MTCTDTDYEAKALYGGGCSSYENCSWWCGYFDDDDFNSEDMCCTCGGGKKSGNISCFIIDTSIYIRYYFLSIESIFNRFTSLLFTLVNSNIHVWQVNTFLESGKTCSTEERYTEFAATLDECKAEAVEHGYSYIYFQDISVRSVEWCHVYESCTNTRVPTKGGTNYEYVGKF